VATLSGSSGDVVLNPSGYCWRSPTPTAQGLTTACLISTPALNTPVEMIVRRGETLTLRFAIGMSPTEVLLLRGTDPPSDITTTALTAANPTTFAADLAVGVHVLTFQTKWNQGDASYRLKVEVRAAPTAADPRPLVLTG
jgi:hypothetical protein